MNELPKRKNQRLKEFDYSESGYYFVTICMKNRKEFFSEILNNETILTEFGKIIEEVWTNLPKFYNVDIDYYIIMPDHFHGIIILDRTLSKQTDNEYGFHSLSEIIGKFKSFTTKKIREKLKDKNEFQWQKSFYDRIIRNEKELYNIRKYIQENPLRWGIEKNNTENLDI